MRATQRGNRCRSVPHTSVSITPQPTGQSDNLTLTTVRVLRRIECNLQYCTLWRFRLRQRAAGDASMTLHIAEQHCHACQSWAVSDYAARASCTGRCHTVEPCATCTAASATYPVISTCSDAVTYPILSLRLVQVLFAHHGTGPCKLLHKASHSNSCRNLDRLPSCSLAGSRSGHFA